MRSDGLTTSGNDRGPRRVCFRGMPFRRRLMDAKVATLLARGACGETRGWQRDALTRRTPRPEQATDHLAPLTA